jgi:hypothetical protein
MSHGVGAFVLPWSGVVLGADGLGAVCGLVLSHWLCCYLLSPVRLMHGHARPCIWCCVE